MIARPPQFTDSSGRYLSDPEQLRPVRETVGVITRLLDILFPEANSLDIITVDDILRRYPLTGLGAPALSAIEQSQRILRARGEYGQVGLGEFHIGLIYLYWHDTRAAANQFALARQPWSLASDSTAICLAHYAQGLALYHAYHNESAMMQFSRAERCLNRPPSGAQATRFNSLAAELRPLLTMSQETLRQSMWPEERTPDIPRGNYLTVPPQMAGAVGGTDEARDRAARDQAAATDSSSRLAGQGGSISIPRPISNLPGGDAGVLRGPVPGHIVLDDRYGWYVVSEKTSGFLPHVVVGTWVLADRDLEERPVEGRDYVVVGSRRTGLGSIIVQPVSHSSAVPYCYLGYRTTHPANALPEGKSQLVLNEAEEPVTDESEVLVVAVVEGFWFGLNGQAG